jgi:hypothetical protein
MADLWIDPLSQVHIKDRSVKLSPVGKASRYVANVADATLSPSRAAYHAQSLRNQLAQFAAMRGHYSRFHNLGICLTAFWQSIAEAKTQQEKEVGQ